MKEKLALRVLGEIMRWDDLRATNEFRWLSLMARLKYDGYNDFLAGVRFIESLASWMQQFELVEEREKAYAFVRQRLVYVGPAEMQRLVELLYPNQVQRRLVRAVASSHGIKPYHVWADALAEKEYRSLLRRTLFIGLSEGARLDMFRRANAGVIGNEQFLLATYAEADKWDNLLTDLRSDLSDANAKFACVYLIDDFVGSGTTFIRKTPDGTKWKGKLVNFHRTVERYLQSHFDSSLAVCVHHYLASAQAVKAIEERYTLAKASFVGTPWFSSVEFSYGAVLPESLPIDKDSVVESQNFVALARKYFDPEDPSLKNKHSEEGGTTDVSLGFAGCALPLILEHNTPNNSVALLWAETKGNDGSDGRPPRHSMRPLFHRRQRHS